MKFKSKEELQKEYLGGLGIQAGIKEAFKSFAERVKFYNKYKDDPIEYEKDFPEITNRPELLWLNHHNYDSWIERQSDFNDWLFNYCFKDVIE